MSRTGWWSWRALALILSLGAVFTGTAWAFQMFPEAEIEEAHALRRRILAEVPQLDPGPLRERGPLPPEAIALMQQRLGALQPREAENPFFYWAQGELLRQTQGPAAAAEAFERARQTAGQRELIHWLLWQEYSARGLRTEAGREERALQAVQLAWGLTRFPLLAREQMRMGSEAADGGDPARGMALYDAALANLPEFPEALFGRASLLWQVDKRRVLEVARDLAAGLLQSFRSRETGFRVTSNLLLGLLVTGLAGLCVVAIILSIKTQPLFGHDLGERALRALPPSARWSLGLWLFLLPLLLGVGVLWAAIVALLLSAPYLTWRERAAVSVLLGVLAGLPFGYEWVAARHLLASSSQFALVQAAEDGGRGDGLVRGLRRWATESPNAGLPRYYLGLVLKRRGELAQAETEMAQAAQLLPRASFVHVGLGNLQYLLGNLPEAEASYRRAVEIAPASAAAHMNLSKLYNQRLQLDQSNEALRRSLALDPHLARTISYFHERGFTQFLIDEPAPWGAVSAALAPRDEDVRVAAESFWGRPLRGVPLQLLPQVGIALLIVFWAYGRLRGRMPRVRRCHQCGTPFCRKCQANPKEREYCAACAAVFRPREGVTAFARIRRIRESEEWARREHIRVGVLGSLIPGGADLFRGRLFPGLFLCLLAVWLFSEGVVLDVLTPSLRFAVPLPGSIRWTAAVLSLLALYLYSAHRSWGGAITRPR